MSEREELYDDYDNDSERQMWIFVNEAQVQNSSQARRAEDLAQKDQECATVQGKRNRGEKWYVEKQMSKLERQDINQHFSSESLVQSLLRGPSLISGFTTDSPC